MDRFSENVDLYVNNIGLFLLQIKKQIFFNVRGEIFPSLYDVMEPITVATILMKNHARKVT